MVHISSQSEGSPERDWHITTRSILGTIWGGSYLTTSPLPERFAHSPFDAPLRAASNGQLQLHGCQISCAAWQPDFRVPSIPLSLPNRGLASSRAHLAAFLLPSFGPIEGFPRVFFVDTRQGRYGWMDAVHGRNWDWTLALRACAYLMVIWLCR